MGDDTQKQLKRTWVYAGGLIKCPDCNTITPLLMGSLLGYPKDSLVLGNEETIHSIARYMQAHLHRTHTAGGRAKVEVPCTCGRKPAKLFFVEIGPGEVLGPWCAGCVYQHILHTLGGETREDFPIYIVPVTEGTKMFAGLVLPEYAPPKEEASGPEPPPF
jgi:hypothetical protein